MPVSETWTDVQKHRTSNKALQYNQQLPKRWNQSMDQSIDRSIHPSFHPSIYHQSIHQSINLSNNLFMNQSINQSINLSINRTLHQSFNKSRKKKGRKEEKKKTKFGATSEATMGTDGLLQIAKLTGEINLLTATKWNHLWICDTCWMQVEK